MALLTDKRKRVLSSHVFKFVLFYFLYCLVLVTSFLLIISIVSFFHFLLGHRFNTIEDWVFRNAWQLIIAGKVIAGLLVFNLLTLKVSSFNELKSFVRGDLSKVNYKIFIILIYFYSTIFFLGRPIYVENINFNTGNLIKGYIGVTFFYLIDFLLFSFLRYVFPLRRRREKTSVMILMTILFYLVTILIFPFSEYITAHTWFHMLICLCFVEFSDNSMSHPIIYILLFVAPVSVLFGLDPIWGELYARFKFSQPLHVRNFLGICIAAFLYLWFTGKVKEISKTKGQKNA